ncbi:MAG: Peptidase M16 domain protein [Candidatus Yanofskybacteria bacterium GW2011_GWA1_44_21]|uniref:Peptidase M16 n=2 Tax=Candidatus Yanofskyibacteriota TaxID=1752733 RepID=A0A1F8GZU4_9BACT|nr:MAG: Peptidase M16 domain protein [Candidatus Yanofskybacteria bacterium GW2011_GWA1_44_21]KKT89989.1 MAG: Peptidase M16 domain protein [Candidatus Yanofskybacteria bacterium GW2011_GWB1_45_11]OGN14729.1 MAG: hypothetical protein A3C01_02190 [Candidatus Yanofskybacteria bacterium RIFCSPHIGHO2_02_FULL_44_36b]OGN18364.1 MAG: hypothetical protein A3F50_00210 [Candidatus Yanofskybacteria bacterium RIFCSPHIGHO2_12_FULL_44_29b]OGN30942.1 MAG: hypothetical protein A3I96_01265 [Candidatus Yanofskyba
MDSKYTFETLSSGLRLVLVPMEGTRTVTVMVIAGTGSKYETKEISGISHFLEHMMFKGTSRRPGPLDISQELESIGADYNAFTSKENTAYYARSSSDKFDLILDVVSDIYLNSKLDERDITMEKGVILEEINMRHDDPTSHVAELLEELIYGDQPAGWEIAGNKETIINLKRQDFVNYFNTHYVSGNTVIAVAGNINIEEAKEKVIKTFEHLRESKPVGKPAVIEAQEKPEILISWKDTNQSHFYIGLRAYHMFDEKRYAESLLAMILGGGMSSRLFQEVREKRGLAYYVGSDADMSTDTGIFTVRAGVNKDKTHEAIKVVIDELRKIKEHGITEKELRQAKDHAKGSLAIFLENSRNIAGEYGGTALFFGKVLTPEEKLAKINEVTAEDILNVARDVFDNRKLNLALIGPFKDDSEFRSILTI